MTDGLLTKRARSFAVALPRPFESKPHWVFSAQTAVGPMYTHAGDTEVGRHIRDYGSWALGETEFVRHFVQPGMTVVDVGANVGYFSRLLSTLVGEKGRVIAIEPVPDTIELLRANAAMASVDNIAVLAVAAGEADSQLTIWLHPEGNFGGNRATPFGSQAHESVSVTSMPLDKLLDPDCSVDFIKIDIEGMDHVAIEGMREIMVRHRPTILCEFNVSAMREAGIDPRTVLDRYAQLELSPRLLGSDAWLLSRCCGLDLESWLQHDLFVIGHEDELIDCVGRVHLANLVLSPQD